MKASNVTIRRLTLADEAYFIEGLSILNRTQGDGMFKPGFLEEIIAGQGSAVFGAFNFQPVNIRLVTTSRPGVAVQPNATLQGSLHQRSADLQIVGLGVAKLIDNYDFYAPFADNWNEKFAGKTVGSFSTMAVHEEFQGQGIGQKISHERLAFLKSLKADYIVGISWVSGLQHTSDRVFEKMGFKKVKVVPNLFSEYSLKNPFICPVCGEPPCNCLSAMYIKEL